MPTVPVVTANDDGQSAALLSGFTYNTGGGGDPHAYFNTLKARSDCFAWRDLRSASSVASVATDNTMGDWAYVYPTDPYPNKQDAMKIRIRQGTTAPQGHAKLVIGPTNGAHLLFTDDFLMGAEWDSSITKIVRHKNYAPIGFEVHGGNPGGTWFENEIEYDDVRQFVSNLPPGGPYVAMCYPHLNVTRVKSPWWRGLASVPYTAPSTERRTYAEAIQPFDTATYTPGQEFGIVPGRWHRLWHYFERTPAHDWVDPVDGVALSAYEWSFWFADTVRPVTRMLNAAIVGVRTTSLGFQTAVQGFGSGNVNLPGNSVVRGDLVAYSRNWVALHGVSKATVLTLLEAPI